MLIGTALQGKDEQASIVGPARQNLNAGTGITN